MNAFKLILLSFLLYLLIGSYIPAIFWMKKYFEYGLIKSKSTFLLQTIFVIPNYTIRYIFYPAELLVWPYRLYEDYKMENFLKNNCKDINNLELNWNAIAFGKTCFQYRSHSPWGGNCNTLEPSIEPSDYLVIAKDCCTNQGLVCKVTFGQNLKMTTSVMYIDPWFD